MTRNLFTRWILFVAGCIALSMVCGFFLGVETVFRFGLFLLAVVVPIIVGSLAIYRFAWHRENVAMILVAGLLGFAAFATFLLGLVFDPDSTGFSWGYLLATSLGVGVIVFIFVIVVAFAYAAFFRTIRQGRK